MLFRAMDWWVTRQQRKQLESYLAGLRTMTEAEVAELLVIATHFRNEFLSSGTDLLRPAEVVLSQPAFTHELSSNATKAKSQGNIAAFAALALWVHTLRAAFRPALLPFGQMMWAELSRGMWCVAAVQGRLEAQAQTSFDTTGCDQIPFPFSRPSR